MSSIFERLLAEAVPADAKDGRPGSFIQWKGTDLCMDFLCPCGGGAHICETFVYAVQCGRCGRKWHLSPTVSVREVMPGEDDGSSTFVMEEDWPE